MKHFMNTLLNIGRQLKTRNNGTYTTNLRYITMQHDTGRVDQYRGFHSDCILIVDRNVHLSDSGLE